MRGARSDLGDHHVIHRKHQPAAEIAEQLPGELDLVFLDQRFAGGQPCACRKV